MTTNSSEEIFRQAKVDINVGTDLDAMRLAISRSFACESICRQSSVIDMLTLKIIPQRIPLPVKPHLACMSGFFLLTKQMKYSSYSRNVRLWRIIVLGGRCLRGTFHKIIGNSHSKTFRKRGSTLCFFGNNV